MTTHATLAARFRTLSPAVLDLVGMQLLGRPLDLTAPYGDLVNEGWLAVDALLILARSPGDDTRAAMSTILGHPVAVGTPCLSGARWPDRPEPQAGPRFTRVDRNPRLPTTPAFARYRLLRVGMTVQQYLTRGGTRRDVREMIAAGWVEVSA